MVPITMMVDLYVRKRNSGLAEAPVRPGLRRSGQEAGTSARVAA